MSGLILPPNSNGNVNPFAPPWERTTPEGTSMVLATLPKELIDHIVARITNELLLKHTPTTTHTTTTTEADVPTTTQADATTDERTTTPIEADE